MKHFTTYSVHVCKEMHFLQQNTAEYHRAPQHTTTLKICNSKNNKRNICKKVEFSHD